ncbi:hypothetical protein ACWEO4_36190 [Streptomyces sp. NPDC004393]
MTGGEEFPAVLDRWTTADWDEYADRIQCGEGSVRAMDAVTRRRARMDARAEPRAEASR